MRGCTVDQHFNCLRYRWQSERHSTSSPFAQPCSCALSLSSSIVARQFVRLILAGTRDCRWADLSSPPSWRRRKGLTKQCSESRNGGITELVLVSDALLHDLADEDVQLAVA